MRASVRRERSGGAGGAATDVALLRRDAERDAGTAAGQRVGPHDAAVLDHDLPRQVQPDADAGLLLAQRRLAGGERLRNACAATPRSSPSPRSVTATTTPSSSSRARARRSAPGGVPAGVVQELVDDAADPASSAIATRAAGTCASTGVVG